MDINFYFNLIKKTPTLLIITICCFMGLSILPNLPSLTKGDLTMIIAERIVDKMRLSFIMLPPMLCGSATIFVLPVHFLIRIIKLRKYFSVTQFTR